MKKEHVGLVVVGGFVALAYFTWWISGSATNCGFIDSILHKCGAS